MHPLDWLLAEILAGLQRLLCLSLDRTPAAEVLEGTARSWREAIASARAWHRPRDESGVREAFTILQRTSTRWPAPADFLRVLPPLKTDTSAPTAVDPELEAARADLSHFERMNALWRETHDRDIFDIHRCLTSRQKYILGISSPQERAA